MFQKFFATTRSQSTVQFRAEAASPIFGNKRFSQPLKMSHKDVEFMSDVENPQPRQLKHDPTEKKMFVCVNLSKQFQSNQASFNQAQKDL